MFFALSQLLIFGLLIWVIVYGTKQFRNKQNRLIKNIKSAQWIVIGYLAILLISLPITVLLSMNNQALGTNDWSENDVYEYENYLNEVLSKGELDEATDENETKEWQFDLVNDKLNIKLQDYGHIKIFVEEVTELEEEFVATYFKPKFIVNEMEISEEINPIILNLMGYTMTIYDPEITELNYAKFESEFPIKQFYGGDWMSRGSVSMSGQRMLYLQVPKGLEISRDGDFELEYVN